MLKILYRDDGIVVCVKPVGVDSQTGVAEALGEPLFCVHRLDRNVGGVMVYARTKQAAAALSRAVQDGSMQKEYLAMVHGVPPEAGEWEDLLFKDSAKNKVFVVGRQRAGVKQARLTFVRLRAGEESLVRVRLQTGRTHQIRVQFASRGFPLVGDRKYGARDDCPAPMLFSCCLRFPWKGQERVFSAQPEWESPE